MNIVIIGRGIPSEKYPLNGIFEMDQVKALSSYGHNVTYIAIDLRSIRRQRSWGIHSIYKEDYKIIEVNIPCGRIPDGLLYNIGKIALEYVVKRYIKLDEIDIVHAHFFEIAIIASMIDFKRAKFFITEHSSSVFLIDNKDKRYERIKKAYKRASNVIAVSSIFSKKIKNIFGVETCCVGNIADDKMFHLQEKNNNDYFTYVTTARLAKEKRIDLIIDAFYELNKEEKNNRLLIIGDGPEKENLIKLVNEKHLEKSVSFLGMLSRPEINNEYSHCNCFILASESETFGLVYIEAMLAGLPVIATNCGGPQDFINEKNGLLVDVDDVQQLKVAMKAIKNRYHMYNSTEIVQYAINEFSADAIASKLTKLYKM